LTRDGEPHAARAFAVVKSKIDGELSKNPILGYFGVIALGQIAGSGESNGPIERYLVEKALTRGGNTQTRAWSAIALGVAAFRQLERGVRLDDAVGNELLTRLQALRDGSSRAAFALSLGLRRHAASALELRRCLDEVKDDEWRGYFATALGLLGDRGAIPRIQELVKASTRRPETLRESAIALGLLGDKETVPVLVAILRSADSNVLAVQAAVASALGTIGDYRALRPLADTLTNSKGDLTEGARAFSAVALGLVCDKEEYPWNFKISTDLNYTATVSTLNDQALQSGILNLL
jgi:hypothetical protein